MSPAEVAPAGTPDPVTDPEACEEALRSRAAAAVAGRPGRWTPTRGGRRSTSSPRWACSTTPTGWSSMTAPITCATSGTRSKPAHGLKFWAHLTSTDLVHWVDQPPALAPSSACDMHGCYSGSGIVHDGSVRFVYTGNVFSPDGVRLPHQNLATRERGRPGREAPGEPGHPSAGRATPATSATRRSGRRTAGTGWCWAPRPSTASGRCCFCALPDLVSLGRAGRDRWRCRRTPGGTCGSARTCCTCVATMSWWSHH